MTLRIPAFLLPDKKIITILRVNAGIERTSVKKFSHVLDIYTEPLPLVFLFALGIYKLDKTQISNHLMGIINHARFGNILTMAAFQYICKELNKNNIPVLAQKGLVQKLLYPSTIRPMSDADFTVPKQQYKQAVKIAQNIGFTVTHDMIGSTDMQYKDQGCIDIHYALFKGANPEMENLIFSRAQPAESIGCKYLLPCPEDRLLIIMCEFYGNFLYEAGSSTENIKTIFARHPQWVLEAYKIIKENPKLSWGKIIKTASISNYAYQIKILALLLNKIFPNIIDEHNLKVIDYMCPDDTIKNYLKRDNQIVRLYYNNSKWYIKHGENK